MIPPGILLVLVVGVIGVLGNVPSYPTSRPLDPLMMKHSGFMKNDTGSSDHHNQTSVPGNKTRNGTIPTFPIFPNSSNLHGNLTRARRNADPLSKYSHKLSTVARISNGISLLAGLINGNIPVDSVIQELLNFGDVKVQDVLALDKNKVDTALNELEGANGTLKTTAGAVKVEKVIIGCNRVKEAYADVGDFSTYQVPSEYFADIEAFETDPTDFQVFKSLSTAINQAIGYIDNLEATNPSTITSTNYGFPQSSIMELALKLKTVIEAPRKYGTIVEAVDKFQRLNNPEETFKTLFKMLEVLIIHRKLELGIEADQEITANMATITSLSTKINVAEADLVKIDKLLSGLSHQLVTRRQFTPGFFKGASDLKLLTSDIRDPSVEQTIGTGKNFARLSGGLKPLEALSNKLDPVETKLRPIVTPTSLQSAKNVLTLVSLMSKLQLSENDVTTSLSDLAKCDFAQVAESATASIEGFVNNLKKLASELALMKSLAQNPPEPPPEVAQVKRILDSLQSPTENNVRTTVNALKAASAKVTIVKTYLNGLNSSLANAPDGVKLLAMNIAGGKQAVEGFNTRPGVVTAMTALKTLGQATRPIGNLAKGAQAIQIIRSFKKDDITSVKSAMDTISEASGLIREVQSVPNAIKKNKTEDVKELVAMKKSQETATTLGFAAGSIRNMDGLQGLEASVVALKNDKNFKTEVEKLTDPKKSDIQRKYGDHTALVTALETSLQQIDTFKSSLAVEKNLTKLGAPLTAATSVSDVTQSFKEKSEAIGMLILEVTDTQTKTNLQALKDHMDQLGALDLNYASGHTAFPQVPAALGGLFTFLTDFLTPKRATAAPAAPRADGSADGGGGTMMLFFGIGLVVAVLIGVAIFVVCYIRKKRNKNKVISQMMVEPGDAQSFQFSHTPNVICEAGFYDELVERVSPTAPKNGCLLSAHIVLFIASLKEDPKVDEQFGFIRFARDATTEIKKDCKQIKKILKKKRAAICPFSMNCHCYVTVVTKHKISVYNNIPDAPTPARTWALYQRLNKTIGITECENIHTPIQVKQNVCVDLSCLFIYFWTLGVEFNEELMKRHLPDFRKKFHTFLLENKEIVVQRTHENFLNII